MRTPGTWLLLGFGLVSCTSDTTPTVYVGLSYQIRCLDCQPRALDDVARNVKAVDEEAGHRLACRVEDRDGTKRVTFSLAHDSSDETKNYSLRVNNGNLTGGTDDPCELTIVEGANTYKGGCSSEEPNADRPCQVSFELDRSVLRGSLYCNNIGNEATANVTRYVVAPLSREPVKFEIYGCTGL